MTTNIEVTKIINTVSFKVDNASYKRALMAIRKIGSEWTKVQNKMAGPMAQGRGMGGGGGGYSRSRGNAFVGPQPRTIVTPTREQLRQQRNESNRSARAQETITAGNIRRSSMFGGAGNAAMGSQVASLNQQLKSGAISLQVYRQSVAALERDFKRASAGGRDFLGTLREVRSAFIALTAANLAFTGGAAVMRTGQMFEGINASMSMTSDSTSETASKIKFIRDEAYRLGLDLKVAAQGFVQMSVAGKEVMSGNQMKDLFTGYSEYATALGVDSFRFEKGVLAIGQMLNKQQIMA